MTANWVAEYQALPSRLKIAGALIVAALALTALDAALSAAPPPQTPQAAIARVEASAPGGLRNLAYYPEQLAALSSLTSFEPRADAGAPVPPPAAARPPAQIAPIAPKPARHAAIKASVRAAPAPAPAPARQKIETPVKILGLAVPSPAAIGARVADFRDSASHFGEAALSLGGRITTFWR
ncbi:hypothetical protein [Rhodoblastus sp.]|uniref:hypothetical protein n=1 Tax=Rhodoblastus sp. TaxID=1962975 RepID=UPI003F96F3F4